MNPEFDRENTPRAGQRPAYEPPAHVKFKQRQKEVSLVRPFILAFLMLLAVVLLAPAVRLLRQPEPPRAGLVDDVEERELPPPPELPDPFIELPELEIPQLPPEVTTGDRQQREGPPIEVWTPTLIPEEDSGQSESMGALLRESGLRNSGPGIDTETTTGPNE